MKRSTIALAVLAAALPLAACGSSTEAGNTSSAAVTSNGSEMSADALGAKIRALPEGQRRGVLFRAIRDAGPSGASCQSVTAMKEAAPVNGNPSWNAVCDGTAQWTIVMTADQSASVTGPGPVTIKS
ncbi:hypothetical protein QE385_001865 [Sphingomonas sp. SORGH_AS 950]|uniref:hypothetical protein n=1 Tax=Sphingomonas sp. SORGH_AS_0950 TaxID=3041792 RepID=UPI002789E8CB|nr:hypothetical protein [Sphingomonas sp. SORGH_AS_0950]MDQ1157538.1 hypothetical protein [Sphingomonas sp. SORGH_AS_0950]